MGPVFLFYSQTEIIVCVQPANERWCRNQRRPSLPGHMYRMIPTNVYFYGFLLHKITQIA